jgi:SAM-dependent methyltransferase
VIEHVRSPFDFLQEIHRVLKPGGTLFIATPSIDSWSAGHAAEMDGIQSRAPDVFRPPNHPDGAFQIRFPRDHRPGWKILNFDT